jgi:methylated-DNA-[protein]-cysteine S-methyltransferase
MTRFLYSAGCPTPIGTMFLAADTHGLVLCCFSRNKEDRLRKWALNDTELVSTSGNHPVPGKAKAILAAAKSGLDLYFQGRSQSPAGLKLTPHGTPFQQLTWQAIAKVPYGKTLTYGELAKAIGKPRAFRAVASACKANPLAIIVPCHRIVASGALGGYNSGTAKKKYLLRHEGVVL